MESYLHDLATRQAEAARVSVIVANSAPRYESCIMEGVRVERLARISTIASMPVCPGLAAAIRRAPADIVHIHLPNPGAALAFLVSGHKGKLVITHHADTMGRRLLRQLSDPFVNRLMQRGDLVIVTSARYLDSSFELAEYRDKCRVIPLGIGIRETGCMDEDVSDRLREQYGSRLVLAVGRLVPYKGFDVLIRAMKHIDARLVLIGTGPQHDALANLVATEGLESRVTILGRVDDLSPFFAAASVFVLPSLTRAEAFGLAQVEAMAAGVPVVNTDIDSAVPEVCKHGETGFTVKPGDPAALAEAVRLLLDRKDLRSQFGEAARARVRSEYTADQMAARTMSAYSELLTAA